MNSQLPLFQPNCDWSPPRISELPSWSEAGRVCVDVETCDPLLTKLGPGVRRGAYIAGYSFSIEDGPSYYVPIRHLNGDNVSNPVAAMDYLRDQSKSFKGTLCGANMQYDLDFLAEQDVVFRAVKWFRDCQIAEPLLDELQFSYSLDAIANRRGIPGKDETQLRDAAIAWGVDPKSELYKLPARFVAEYAIQDVNLPLQLLRRQEREIDEQDLWQVYDLESKLLPILVKMRRRGIRIDFDQLEKVEAWSFKEEQKQSDIIKSETGFTVPVGDYMKADLVARPLMHIGQEVPKTPETKKYSVVDLWLENIQHPVAAAIRRGRKVSKLRSTFAKSIRRHAIGDRVHCTFNQLRRAGDDDKPEDSKGARYGRLSCCDPNLQQQPSRDDFAKMWRSIYIPDEDGLWAAADYSQQEPRILVHYAEGACLRGAFEAGEKYRNDPDTDFHTFMSRLIYNYSDTEFPTKKERDDSKQVFLAICYGMGGAKTALKLGLPTAWKINSFSGQQYLGAGEEAQAIIDKLNKHVPFVKKMAKLCQERAGRNGYIRTLSGRRCRFPELADGSGFDWLHKSLNRLIQGSAGDQTKMAMVAADETGFKIQIQVHDEIGQTVQSAEEGMALGKLMRNVIPLRIPSKVDVDLGPSWGETA